MTIKAQLFQACKNYIESRIETINLRLRSLEDSKNNETKSSAGDKFETGRSMMQLEEAKCKGQLAEANLVKMKLQSVKLDTDTQSVGVGHLVSTNKGQYFIAIGAGKLKLNNDIYYAISSASPIAKLLFTKKAGEHIQFNGNEIRIDHIE